MSAAILSRFNRPWIFSSPLYDLTPDAVLGSREDFLRWRGDFAAQLDRSYDAVRIPGPPELQTATPERRDGYTLQKLVFRFPAGFVAGGRSVSGLLAVPDRRAKSALVIALHGHEIGALGEAPYQLFDGHRWPEQFVKAGYVVWAPGHLFYDALPQFRPAHDYHILWTKMESVMLDAALPLIPAHEGTAVVGLSSGGTTGAFLMAYRRDIGVGVFAGSLVSLGYLRENYRVVNHPDQWDVRMLMSYAPVWALIAPRPVQWQMGRRDGFFPRTTPLGPIGSWFPGTRRGVMTTEMVGEFLAMREIWRKAGGDISLSIHDGGHELAFREGEGFIADHFKADRPR